MYQVSHGAVLSWMRETVGVAELNMENCGVTNPRDRWAACHVCYVVTCNVCNVVTCNVVTWQEHRDVDREGPELL